MYTGTLRVRLLVREARSLKDKRQVVRGILDRLRNSFNISIAEVEAEDQRQIAVLGVALVGNEAGHVRATLEQVANALRAHPVAEFVSHEMEVEASF